MTDTTHLHRAHLHLTADAEAACPTCNPSPMHSPRPPMTDTTPTLEGVTHAYQKTLETNKETV